MKRTTVSLDEKTKEQLAKLGEKGESFDDIISRVITKASNLCSRGSSENDVVDEES